MPDKDNHLVAREDLEVEHFRVTTRAFFFQLEKVLKMDDLVTLVGNSASGLNIKPMKADYSIGRVAIVLETHHPKPAFLKLTQLSETRYGIVLAATYNKMLAVHVAGGSRWKESVLKGIGKQLERETLAAYLEDDTEFRRVQIRVMATGEVGVHSKTLEAQDLERSLSPAGLNRSIAQSARVSKGGKLLSANPATGRLGQASARVSPKEFLKWARSAASDADAAVKKAKGNAGFLGRFARLAKMEEVDKRKIKPTGVLIDTSWLVDGVEDGQYELVRKAKASDSWDPLPEDEVEEFLDGLGKPGVVDSTTTPPYEIDLQGWKHKPLKLAKGKRSFSIQGPGVRGVRVYDNELSDARLLTGMLREKKSLLVTMSDIRFAYANGSLYVDPALKSFVGALKFILSPVDGLKSATGEKGVVRNSRQRKFSSGSMFRIVEDEISEASKEDYLVCDDLNDEWADFIGVSADPTHPRVSLYHAKYDKRKSTLSASAFQEVIGQALKNVGRIAVIPEELAGRKSASWRKGWTPKGSNRLKRLRRGKNLGKFEEAYLAASRHPSCVRRICVVVSFLSLKALTKMFKAIEDAPGDQLPDIEPNESQLVHLLTMFVSSCLQSNTQPVIYCRP